MISNDIKKTSKNSQDVLTCECYKECRSAVIEHSVIL